jgi:predicted nucleic acid-binding protein
MKQKIYIDTSIVGGYYDREFSEATQMLFNRLENNEIIFVVSDLLDLELTNASQQVREHLNIQQINFKELNLHWRR